MHRFLRLAFWSAFLLALPVMTWGGGPGPARGLGFQDLLDLVRSGLDSAVVIAQVETLGLDFEPTPRQLASLREAGLGPDVLAGIVRKAGLSVTAGAPVETVRIFRQRQADGRVLLVLTNLDDQGNPIRDPAEAIPPVRTPDRPGPPPEPAPGSCAPRTPPESESLPPAPVVVVNVQAPVSPSPWVSLPVAVGGIAGPYRYPEHLGFLGYGQGISSPGWFSGLGLNAANNFGHRVQDKPNTRGLGAFFGPPSRPRR